MAVLAFAGRAWTLFQLQQDAESDALCALRNWGSVREPTRVAQRYLARTHYILGELSFSKNNAKMALERIEDALAYYGVDRDSVDGQFDAADVDQIATASYRLGILVFRRNERERALIHFLRARRLLQQRANADEFNCTVLAAEAIIRIELGQLRAALSLFDQWEAGIDRMRPRPIDESRQARIFGYLNLVAGRYKRAGELFQRAGEVLGRCCAEDPQALAKLTRHRARLRKRIGDYAGSLDLISPDWITEEDSQASIRDLNVCGEIRFATGKIPESRSCFETAAELADGGAPTNLSDRVATSLGLSRIETTQGMFQRAEDLAAKTIRDLEKHNRSLHPEMAHALLEVSCARFHRGFRDAGPICDEAIDLLGISLGQQSAELPEFMLARAEIHWSRAEIDEGLRLSKDAQGQLLEQRPHDRFAFARLETIRGKLFHMRGNLPAARACFADAWDHWNQKEQEIGCEHPEKCQTMLALATLFTAYGDYESSKQLFTLISHPMLKLKGNKEERVAYELNWQGNIYFVNEHYREAEWLFGEAASIYGRLLGDDHAYSLQSRINHGKARDKMGIRMEEADPNPSNPHPRPETPFQMEEQ